MAFYYVPPVYTPVIPIPSPLVATSITVLQPAAASPGYGQIDVAGWATLDQQYISPTHRAWGRYRSSGALQVAPVVPALLTPQWVKSSPPLINAPGASPDQGWRFWRLKQ